MGSPEMREEKVAMEGGGCGSLERATREDSEFFWERGIRPGWLLGKLPVDGLWRSER